MDSSLGFSRKMKIFSKLSRLICILLSFFCCKSFGENIEKVLYEDLLHHYEPRIRPVENHSDAILVNVEAELVRILNVNEDYGEITAVLWFRLNWTDSFLQWDEEKYDNVTEMILPIKSVWTPDLVLYNGIKEFTLKQSSNSEEVLVDSDGDVYWTVSAHVTASCVIQSASFPFDKHQCELEWGSWAYSMKQVDLAAGGAEAQQTAESPQWKIDGVKMSRREIFYTCCPGQRYPRIFIQLNLRRRSVHYAMGLIFPCVIFSFLILLQFLIPPNIGERVVYGILSMIFLAIFGYFVSGFSLKSWPTLPLIAIYLFCLLLGASAALTNTCLVVNFFYAKHNTIMSPWVKKLVLTILPEIVCMRNLQTLIDRKLQARQRWLKLKPLPSKEPEMAALVEPLLAAEREKKKREEPLQLQQIRTAGGIGSGTGIGAAAADGSVTAERPPPLSVTALLEILRDIRQLSHSINVRLAETRGSIEWTYAAEVVNRFGLITLTVYFTLCHVIIVINALL